MKYSLYINQGMAIELGLTNINQTHVFDLCTSVSTWAKPEVVDGEVYYWVARQVIVDELPLLNMKPDTVYRHLKSIAKLRLIDYIKVGKKDCIRVTALGKKYFSKGKEPYVGNKSELDSGLGNKSEKDAENSEINPTYHTTTSNPTTNVTPNGDAMLPTEKELEEERRMNQAWLIAGLLYGSLETSLEKIKPLSESAKLKWAKDIEKLIRIDGNTGEEIVRVINWIHKGKGSFWIPNIQSGKKLRDQFPTLWAQMSQDGHKPVSAKNRIQSEVGLGKVFFAYADKDLDASVSLCLYGEYTALYDFYRNKYIDKDKAVKLWEYIDEHVDSILTNYKNKLGGSNGGK